MLTRIQTVAKGKEKTDNKGVKVAGKPYGLDSEGNVFFPGNGVVLVAGEYANVVAKPSREQLTPGVWTNKPDGSVDHVAVATWKTKAEGIEAMSEKKLVAIETEQYLREQAIKVLGELTPERMDKILQAEMA